MKKKILAITIVTLFLGSAILPTITSISTNEIGSLDDSSCYGFIVPIVKLDNETLANDINCRIHHMVNDFLREQIPVYWASTNFTTSILKINGTDEEEMFFEKGTFIIPFTENNTVDTKIIAIICDYNQSSEIEEDAARIPVYQLIESLEIKAHELSEVKIGRYVGCRTHNTQFFMIIATQCGFLDFDIAPAEEIEEKLTNEDYNVIIWPGATIYKLVSSYCLESQLEEIKYNVMNTIREFVSNGGGYVGPCYGSAKPSNLWITSSRRPYFPTLRIAGTIAIEPKPKFDGWVICKQKIIANDNPMTYGLDQLVTDFYGGGPKLICIGKNTHAVTEYQNCCDYLDGTPGWVSNIYKDGKVVSYSSHPEIMAFLEDGFNGRHVVSNTWFHLTNKGIIDISCEKYVNLSVIDSVFENTSNLVNNSIEPLVLFDDVRNSINDSISKIKVLESKIFDIKAIVDEIAASERSTSNMYDTIRKILGGKNISDGINLSTYYFEKTSELLSSIEKIYPLLENDTNFTEKTQSFNETILLKINYIDDLISKAQEDAEKSEDALKRYQNNSWFLPKVREFYINDMLFRIREKISEVFVRISQINHESLKFLRHHWYNYESSIEI